MLFQHKAVSRTKERKKIKQFKEKRKNDKPKKKTADVMAIF